MKLLEIGADDAERWEKKKKKKNPDPGFSGGPPALVVTIGNQHEIRRSRVGCSVRCGCPRTDWAECMDSGIHLCTICC